ncbi:MAG TPA: integrase [Pseudoalteromonas sp.]|nr:integrase [Pseudoalteromonas sp.]|tara:strand:- start:2777 stop:4000 length:1224 start_codon:yes stop_codon:yes gene_type:complete
MATPAPYPLFPTLAELKDLNWNDYTELNSFLTNGPYWWLEHWQWAKEYLIYIGRNKSEHTYVRFRSDIEKFLLWSLLIIEKPITQLKKSDILDYTEFFFKPPQTWIGLKNVDKFLLLNGYVQKNKDWKPFRYISEAEIPDKKKYRPSQQSLQSMFTAIIGFYNYLMDEEYALGNPASIAKKDCKRLIKDAQVKETKRLDQEQWQFLLQMAESMAEQDPIYERNLFLLAAMKTLFLRISELSEREDWSPAMNHFWQDDEKNWWLKIYGKGRKLRDITVPDSFLPYLIRYRHYRGLSDIPSRNEREPIVEKLRGTGGMTARQLSRLVEAVLKQAYDKMKETKGPREAQIFQDVSSHWLRHTGASMEIERGRALKDVSEDLGHASMATTDTIYVQTVAKKRAESGKKRDV